MSTATSVFVPSRHREPVVRWRRYGPGVTRYRFLDAMGDVVAEEEFPDHAAALAAAGEFDDEDVFRVEFLGPQGDWRWAGALAP